MLLNSAEWLNKTAAAKEKTIARNPSFLSPPSRKSSVNGDEITIPRGDRRYRIRGLAEESQP